MFRREGSERTESRLGKTKGGYQLLDLMRRGTRRPIRIRSDQFDFSFLGAERNLSANLNLRSMLRHLTRDPSNDDLVVPLEESFRRVPTSRVGPSEPPEGSAPPSTGVSSSSPSMSCCWTPAITSETSPV